MVPQLGRAQVCKRHDWYHSGTLLASMRGGSMSLHCVVVMGLNDCGPRKGSPPPIEPVGLWEGQNPSPRERNPHAGTSRAFTFCVHRSGPLFWALVGRGLSFHVYHCQLCGYVSLTPSRKQKQQNLAQQPDCCRCVSGRS